MRRSTLSPRDGWRETVEDQGLTWHTTETGQPYWDESAFWAFSEREIDRIEAATAELYDMVLEAVGRTVADGRLDELGYDEQAAGLIETSWNRRTWEPTLYARFDLAYDGRDLKMLELNGDTPTSLLEAAVVQWYWLQDRFPHLDQFNSIHEKLIDAFRLYAQAGGTRAPLHFASVQPHLEDEGTVGYMAACAAEAGLQPVYVPIDDIGWVGDGADGGFVDADDQPISALFKLYPWEWLLDDEFGERIARLTGAEKLTVMEPAWKMAASNKALLPVLWRMFPGHELLLPATLNEAEARGWGDHVRKPVRGREGANVTLVERGQVAAERGGAYDDDLFVYQQRAALAQSGAGWAVLGSWVVNRTACGLGVRESGSPITDNTARFVPHVME
jgi:glutathionylspermidine synthase